MINTLEKISRIVISTYGAWLPVLLFILVYAIPKIFPQADKYFKKAYPVLQEVDDITDSILVEFPNLTWVTSVDDIVNLGINVLEKRYKLDDQTKEQVKQRIKANLNKKDGLSINWKDGIGKIEYNKKF